MKLLNSEILLTRLFVASIYIVLFIYIYKNYLYVNYEYMGYEYSKQSMTYTVFTILLSLFPIAFFTGIKNLSSFISLLIYLLAYVPMVLTISFYDTIDFNTRISYQIVLLFAQTSFFCVDKLFTPQKIKLIKKRIPFNILLLSVILISLYIIAINRNNMQFVNFYKNPEDLYSLRSQNSIQQSFGINGYLINWLSKIFYPLLLIIYIKQSKYIKAGFVIVASLLIFSITAGKIDFFMSLIIIAFYFILDKNPDIIKKYFFSIFVFAITFMSVFILAKVDTEIGFMTAAILFMRTLSISGFLFVHYIQFFQNNPYTNFAHINIVNAFTGDYPFGDMPLGRAVFYGGMNGNANFWIMDGVASNGVLGILIISFILFFILKFINRFKTIYDERLLYLIFLPIIISITNVSLFTTLLTGGGILLILILYFVKLPIGKQ